MRGITCGRRRRVRHIGFRGDRRRGAGADDRDRSGRRPAGAWSTRMGGEYSGFDIDVAKYVAKTLGYAEKQIVFKQLSPAMRASALTDGTVDMVVDSFSMDGTHDGEADVAGPYLTVRRRCSSAPTAHPKSPEPTACPIKPYARSLEARRPTTSATARKTSARRWRNATRIRNA